MPKFLANVDLAQNQLLKPRLENLGSAPSSPVSGQLYYDTSTFKAYFYNGTTWVPMDGSASIDYGETADMVASAVGDTADGGSSAELARADHRHARESFGAVTAQTTFGLSSGNGSAATVARSDHTHGTPSLSYGSPAASAVGDTASDGVATTLARSDHRHAREGFGAVTAQTTFGASSGNGSASTLARSDHTHGTPAHGLAEHQELIALTDLTDVSSVSTTAGQILHANGSGYVSVDLDTEVRTNRLDQMAAPTAAVSFNSQKITSLADPTADTDAANKRYVDAARSGLDVKQSVRAASTANVTLTYTATNGTSARGQITAAPNTLDGVTLAANDRILLKDQSTGAQNGIWVVTTLGTGSNGVWDRATDFDSDAEVTSGAFVFVTEGTVNDNSGWVLTTNDPITIGGASGTSLAWTKFSDSAALTAGNGLTQTGNSIDVVGTANRISVAADSVDIAATYVGQTSITTLGTIATGTWSATAIAANRGGTGQTVYAVGDILYASTTTALSKLADVAVGNVLISGGVGVAPSYGKVQLSGATTHINGTLPIANGGTGQTTAAAAIVALGGTRKFVDAANPNNTTWTVTHNLNTNDVIVQVRETSSGEIVHADYDIIGVNSLEVRFAVAPTASSLTAVVIG